MKTLIPMIALVFLALGCAETDFDHDHDYDHDHDAVATHAQPLAVEGPWAPPADIVGVAADYSIAYTGGGAWVGTSGCSGNFTAGGSAFRAWLYDNWPQVTHVGGYSCRAINGNSSSMSVHATGRAVDINIPLDDGQADNDLGDPLANWLVEHAEEIGIQSIIWDRWIWSTSRSNRSRPYTGAHPHHNHIHVELTPQAGKMETPWFQGPMGSPDMSGCGEPLPPEGGVIDDSDMCFQAFGPAQYWRTAEGVGVGGSMRWTNAFKSDAPSNWARWRINLSEAGSYRVEVSRVAEFAVYDSAQYRVRHGEAEDDVFVDLSAIEGDWETLGTFDFEVGEGQWVAIFDNASIDLPADQHVGADAIRLVRIDGENPDLPGAVVGDPPVQNNSEVDPQNPNNNGGETGDPTEQTDDDDPLSVSTGGCSSTATPGSSMGLLWMLCLGFWLRRRG